MRWTESTLTRIAGLLTVFACLSAFATEIVVAGGSFGGSGRFGTIFVDVHYLVINLVLLAAAVTLFAGYLSRRNPVLLHGGLAIGSWLFAHVYWTVYVYLGDTPVTYPSVAELGFQGFHLFAIPVSLYLLRSGHVRPYRPALALLVPLASIPAVTAVWIDLPIHHVVYSTGYLVLIGGSLLLAAHFLRHRHLPLFGAGLALFTVTEAAYVGVTLFDRVVAVPYLDPLWYVGASLVVLALLGYDDQGRLPDPRAEGGGVSPHEEEATPT